MAKPYPVQIDYIQEATGLPRELLDDFFIKNNKKISTHDLMKLSYQLTLLGKNLSKIKTKIKIPGIPILNIKPGNYNIQRFIYWNFIKCFWNEEFGFKSSIATNFDWYAPSIAYKYTQTEFLSFIKSQKLIKIFFNSEFACHSGLFMKNKK